MQLTRRKLRKLILETLIMETAQQQNDLLEEVMTIIFKPVHDSLRKSIERRAGKYIDYCIKKIAIKDKRWPTPERVFECVQDKIIAESDQIAIEVINDVIAKFMRNLPEEFPDMSSGNVGDILQDIGVTVPEDIEDITKDVLGGFGL